jgi:hypothetical protein
VRLIPILIFLFIFIGASAQQPEVPVGMWREHLPYNSAIDVTAAGEKIFCATPYSLFAVKISDKSIERFSRVTGLNETGVSGICYDASNEKLLVAYNNSNIDILYRNDIYNIPDIKRSTITGNKNIYNIFPQGRNFYLSTGIGVIVIDVERYEVSDSWFIGNGGNYVKVNGFTSDGTYFYAATDEGLKRAQVNNLNLANHNNWQLISGTNGLTTGACQNVLFAQGRIYLQKNDSLFIQNGTNWSFFYSGSWSIINSNVSENKIALCERVGTSPGRVTFLNTDGTLFRTLPASGSITYPKKAILVNSEPWIADQFGGLSHQFTSSYDQYKPNSPEAIGSGEMVVYNNIFYGTAGEVNDAWNYQFNGNGIFVFEQGVWENINKFRYPQIDTLLDYITIAIDRRDETIWAGSYGGGLLHVKDGPAFEIFKQNFLGAAIGDPGSYRVAGLCFDNNNLWISNYGSSQPIKVRKADGTWSSFSIPFTLIENSVAQIISDDLNFKWIVSPKGNGLICYDPGNSIENTNDDRWKLYRTGAGNGNLPNNDVTCVALDKSGFVWVGTADGIGVIQCSPDVFSGQGCDAIWPIIQQGNFANYLFKGELVRSIAVDGADRKWVATRNGVWLIDPTGEKVIYRFTEDNSPLLSNDVHKIAINGKTGEVFFATLKGTCSFRSTATEGNETNSGVLVFPNPVPPGFTGTIAIRGVVNNAIVKITELNGRLVYQTRALGGQAVWDGKDYRGKKISSGVYLVLVSDDGRTENVVTKIIFVSK